MKQSIMKNIVYIRLCILQLLCMVVILTFITGCKDDDDMRVPVITEVRNYAPTPNDTLITTLNDGQWVVLHGKNLSAVTQIYFGSIPATFNRAFSTDEMLVVQVPAIPFLSVPRDKLHVITAVSKGGASSYEINITGAPILVRIRNTDGEIIDRVVLEQQINIIGINLENATKISFQGVDADLSKVIYTDSSTIVTVPNDFSGADATLINTISYTTTLGVSSFSIIIIGGPPLVTRVSYEVPKEGDEITIYGSNLFGLQNLTFANNTISSFETSEDGTWIKFKAPKLSESGPVKVTNVLGTFETTYNVNDVNTGALSNYQWEKEEKGTFKWDWWGGATLAVEDASLNEGFISVRPEFKGNGGKFLVMDLPIQPANGGAEWTTAIRATGDNIVTWFSSVDNLKESPSSWVLKFEINVPDNWEGGTLAIRTSNSDYIMRYEPWQISESKTGPYKTSGWTTVTIPFTAFRKSDSALGAGKGAPLTNIKDLFTESSVVNGLVKGEMFVCLRNYSATDTKTKFKAAFDNFRVVKIKNN